MQLKKIITGTAIAVTLSFTSISALAGPAGLSLCSTHNYPHQIDVYCPKNAKQPTPAPIPANGCAHILPGQNVLSWTLIQLTIFHGATHGNCAFKDGNTTIGTADISISGSTGQLSNVVFDHSNYNVAITPTVGSFERNITVNISKT